MNLYSLTNARVAALEAREQKPRSDAYLHISEVATCGWMAWFNSKHGHPVKTFDIKQASKVAGGERLEGVILADFLEYSPAETQAWPPGGLTIATHGRHRIPLVDSHVEFTRIRWSREEKLYHGSPTFVYDRKLGLGGRCDAILAGRDKKRRIWDAKTLGGSGEDVLFDLWWNEVFADYLKFKPFALWWRWPDLWQMVGYMHCASITYNQPIRQAIITYFCKDTLFAFDILLDLDMDPDLVEMQNKLIEQAKTIHDSLKLGEETPPPHLYKVASPRWCDNCLWKAECKPIYKMLAKAEDVTARMPELEPALERYYETQGGKKAELEAVEKLKARVAVLFDEIPSQAGEKSHISVRFKDSLITGTCTYQNDATRPLQDTERETGLVVLRRGGPRLHVKAQKIKEE